MPLADCTKLARSAGSAMFMVYAHERQSLCWLCTDDVLKPAKGVGGVITLTPVMTWGQWLASLVG